MCIFAEKNEILFNPSISSNNTMFTVIIQVGFLEGRKKKTKQVLKERRKGNTSSSASAVFHRKGTTTL